MEEIKFNKERACWDEDLRPENREAVLLDLMDYPEWLLRIVVDDPPEMQSLA